jgi:hypothetical protein
MEAPPVPRLKDNLYWCEYIGCTLVELETAPEVPVEAVHCSVVGEAGICVFTDQEEPASSHTFIEAVPKLVVEA